METTTSPPTSNIAFKVIGVKQPNVKYIERRAVRIIVRNDKDEIIIIFVKSGNYYKFPGGGIEPDEDHILASQREVMEETGCKVAMEGGRIAMTEEWRQDLHQISYCSSARLVEDTGRTELTELETMEGLKHEWVNMETAMMKMRACEPTSELGRFIKERDIFLLEQYVKSRQGSGAP